MREAWHCFELDFQKNPKRLRQISLGKDLKSVLRDANALLIITEWKAFRSPDFQMLKTELKELVIFDGRNLYEPNDLKKAGFEYHGIGRESH
jgi:UDPglucose 6-dehydrogenase